MTMFFLIMFFIVFLSAMYVSADDARHLAVGAKGWFFALFKLLLLGVPTFYLGMIILERLKQ